MATNETYDQSGRLRERWDDATRTYTAWGADGAQTTQRPYTAQESTDADARAAADAQDANHATILTQAKNAMQTNKDFLAIASPTNAQTLTQVRALTRQNNGIIRTVVQDYTGTD